MNNTLLHRPVGLYLGDIGAGTVKVAVATTTAPDPDPNVLEELRMDGEYSVCVFEI